MRPSTWATIYDPTGTSADELEAISEADAARWGPIIKAVGFSAD
jgi:hypothetical protein